MYRTALAAIALFVTTTALAQPTMVVRDTSGHQVDVAAEGTVVLFWSMTDAAAAQDLVQLSERAAMGQQVVAINTDGAIDKARVRPFVRRLGISNVTVAHDTTGELANTLHAEAGEALWMGNAQVASRGEVRTLPTVTAVATR